MSIRPFILAASLCVAATAAQAQEEVRVQFERGNDNAAIEGVVTGRDYVDYLLGAGAGQTLSVSLIPEEGPTPFFNVLPPGSDGVAVYNGSMDGGDATVELSEDGDWIVRVYLMGNAYDAGETAEYMLSFTIQ